MHGCNGVMAPGEAETEGTEAISEIAARLMGRAFQKKRILLSQIHVPIIWNPNQVLLGEAKQSALNLAQFVGDNMGCLHRMRV